MKQLDLIVDYLRQEPQRTVKLLVRGNSMRPFLIHERDYVLLKGLIGLDSTKSNTAANDLVHVGDIVLAEVFPSKYALHRLIRIEGSTSDPTNCHITLKGDGNLTTEQCFYSDLRGIVIGFLRNGQTEPELVSSYKFRLYSLFWMHTTLLRRPMLKVHDLLFHSVKDLKKTSPTDEELDAFLSLLKLSLWKEEVSTSSFENVRWPIIWQFAKKQTVLGQIAGAIQTLPPSIQEKAGGRILIIKTLGNILKRNGDLNSATIKVISFFQSKGLHPVLLKGQGIASFYQEPMSRQSGDIDIYIGSKDFKKACNIIGELVGDEAVNNGELQVKHFTVSYLHSVYIELHKLACLETENLEKIWLSPKKLETISIEGSDIPVPPLQFNVLYIFAHFWAHLIWEGVGLRQLCDWCNLLAQAEGKINLEQLKHDLVSAHLFRGWQIIGWIAVNKLGLSENAMPFYTPDCKKSSVLAWEKILNGGNFGSYNEKRVNRTKGIWITHKIMTALIVTRYAMDSLKIAPKEVFHMYCNKLYKGLKSVIFK